MNQDELISLWNSSKEAIASFVKKEVNKDEIADDIVQEVFIRLWERNASKDSSKIRLWLINAARSCIASYSKENSENEFILDAITLNVIYKHEKDSTLSDESKKLLPLILRLPPKYKNILLLCDIHNISRKTLSTSLDMSMSCIKKRVERARKLLAAKLQECCNFSNNKYGGILEHSGKIRYLEILEELAKKA